ncbi:MAG: hypothetical protein WA421_06520 [Nitrososphaeraceae archaeon]
MMIAIVFPVVLVSLLIAGSFENGVNIQAMAQNSNSSQSTNNNNGTLNVGPPQKMTLSELSKPPVLSPEKRQALEQDQAKIHHNPKLPSSDQAILGPILGTQAP